MPNPEDYTIGWICAVATEYVAAQTCLDEQHGRPDNVSRYDENDYSLGSIAGHNVVIAVLPGGEYGLSSSATVAKDMMRSFPNVRVGLMVGIAGGAPSASHDIRLGDIVVSAPRNGEGGVIQYDFGKTIQGQGFHRSGFLNQPPKVLRAVMSGLETQHEMDGHNYEEVIAETFRKRPRLRKKYSRPSPSADCLFKSSFIHPNQASCEIVCRSDSSNLVKRKERTEEHDKPAIHYGIIASGNQLMKDAHIRDRLANDESILCFEMEAAGLMNHFPCLVIRGICDYSDSHKNDDWQGYAAMVAAAYAKDLLNRMPPTAVEAEHKIIDLLPDLYRTLKEQEDLATKSLQIQNSLSDKTLEAEAQRCHQLFRLTTDTKDATYEWYKDRIEHRVEDTCLWFLQHEKFNRWLNQSSGILLVSADPGCGKSVLAKYLIDHVLPGPSTICYFFFKDQDQNTVRQALCAVLHQLFSQQPILLRHAVERFQADGKGMIATSKSLWKILFNATRDPEAQPISVILDALDECAESEFEDLVQELGQEFKGPNTHQSKAKFLLTSRPYHSITSKFERLFDEFSCVRIPGEEESGAISEEVTCVITHRVKQLARERGLSDQMRTHIEERLQETTHRTYLWIHLVFDFLERELFKQTKAGFNMAIATSPRSVDEAYSRILSKSKDNPTVLKTLQIILAAYRPMTLSELNIAVNIEEGMEDISELDLEEDDDFQSRVRSLCGLFISIHHGKVYFLHQTAREFLLADFNPPSAKSSGVDLPWRGTISKQDAHRALGAACVLWLHLYPDADNNQILLAHESNHELDGIYNSDSLLPDSPRTSRYRSPPFIHESDHEPDETFDSDSLLHYSAGNWGYHIHEAFLDKDDSIIPLILAICDNQSAKCKRWFELFRKPIRLGFRPHRPSELTVASFFGHESTVKMLLEKDADFYLKAFEANEWTGSPLLWAAMNGHTAVTELLLNADAEVNQVDSRDMSPLSEASANGHIAVAEILLRAGADCNVRDQWDNTPLRNAAINEDSQVPFEIRLKMCSLLVHAGADVDAISFWDSGQTPLSMAVERHSLRMATKLLDLGANANGKDSLQQTPLWGAIRESDSRMLRLLIHFGADVNVVNMSGETPLITATWIHTDNMAIERDSTRPTVFIVKNEERRSVSFVRGKERLKNIELLLHAGADPRIKDKNHLTPLTYAIKGCNQDAAELLLRAGADLNLAVLDVQDFIIKAAEWGNAMLVELLIEAGAEVDKRDRYGDTALSQAADRGHADVAQVLLHAGADIEAQNKYGSTPLFIAAGAYKSVFTRTQPLDTVPVVELLLKAGAEVDSKDNGGRTPLMQATWSANEGVIALLLQSGANSNVKDERGQTPLSRAMEEGQHEIVRLLLEAGAQYAEEE